MITFLGPLVFETWVILPNFTAALTQAVHFPLRDYGSQTFKMHEPAIRIVVISKTHISMVHKVSTEPKFFAILWAEIACNRNGGESWRRMEAGTLSNVTAVELHVLMNSGMVSLSYYPDWIRDQLRDRLLGVLL